MSLALALCAPALAAPPGQGSPQFQLGDSLSVFSDRAFRKDGGEVFEAIGNVVVINGKDTLYGESAHFDRRTMIFEIEGNVRLISTAMTLYGSHLEYQALSGYAEVNNARIVTPQFNLIASKIARRNERVFVATDGEFSSCRDCPESWSVFGRRMVITMDEKVEIHHGLAKVKNISVLYLPYMTIPLVKRKTGLLFPDVFSRIGEGFGISQPVFWAIDQNKDATISPTFWATRGYGADAEYRQRFGPDRWFMGNSRIIQDSIYLPGKNGLGESGTHYSRYFSDFENHWQWSPNWVHHLSDTSTRDLDMIRGFPTYTDNRIIGSDIGFKGNVDGRGETWALSIQGEYLRNQLVADPTIFDRSYVQTLPRVAFGTTPVSLVQSKTPGFQHIYAGMDTTMTRFRQVDQEDADNPGAAIRNADRLTANPYVNWHFFTWGPVSVKSNVMFDYQKYRFGEVENERREAEKNTTLMKTEASFTMDRIFGLAYDESVPIRELPAEARRELRPKKDEGPKSLLSTTKGRKLVGALPDFNTSLTEDTVPIQRHAYRHSQEFKFIHHYITSQNVSGSHRFESQIQTNKGWFDYTDAIRSREYLLGSNTTRTIIPPNNTLELQWNNVLIRKSPQNTDWRVDQRYLRDNFAYSKLGYFNVSQGYIYDNEFQTFREHLTRLNVAAGYNAEKWSIAASEYFFHVNSQHIFQLSGQRQFEYFNLLSAYNYNSFGTTPLQTLSAGLQLRPVDSLGFSVLKLVDLNAHEDIRNVYALDYMPANECWIFHLNYRQTLVGHQILMNVDFNFGQDKFQNYRNNWFAQQARRR